MFGHTYGKKLDIKNGMLNILNIVYSLQFDHFCISQSLDIFHLSLFHIVSASYCCTLLCTGLPQSCQTGASIRRREKGQKTTRSMPESIILVLDGWGAVIVYAIVQQTVADQCSS